jgi:hypothetical protein
VDIGSKIQKSVTVGVSLGGNFGSEPDVREFDSLHPCPNLHKRFTFAEIRDISMAN